MDLQKEKRILTEVTEKKLKDVAEQIETKM